MHPSSGTSSSPSLRQWFCLHRTHHPGLITDGLSSRSQLEGSSPPGFSGQQGGEPNPCPTAPHPTPAHFFPGSDAGLAGWLSGVLPEGGGGKPHVPGKESLSRSGNSRDCPAHVSRSQTREVRRSPRVLGVRGTRTGVGVGGPCPRSWDQKTTPGGSPPFSPLSVLS